MSEEGRLLAALIRAKKDMGPLVKNATNPQLRNQFADLGSVLDCITEPLLRHGLYLYQRVDHREDGSPVLVTTLYHESGAELPSSRYPIVCPPSNRGTNEAQMLGIGITYARRYAAQTMLGLHAEDSDGAGGAPRAGVSQRAPSPPAGDDAAAQARRRQFRETRDKAVAAFKELHADPYHAIIDALNDERGADLHERAGGDLGALARLLNWDDVNAMRRAYKAGAS